MPVFNTNSRPTSQSVMGVSRVGESTEDTFDDYITASWIDSCLKKQVLIAASAPKRNTVSDFLHMIMEKNVKLVMKVCEDKVDNKEQCFRYTPKMCSEQD